ncbi:beta-lactamase/transpeptidase-like protein [Crepidotus variabilis]|uniref:Beta-lactamase/transpeptidase-like protein n=1 Tax=Crepidotus variabilis TaxID=179855 RepID=A0A9P6ERA7_9AGAR|nr:beta-lactamase/transpeptidase-like protein [Crepidotus variabilis]
MVTHVAALIAVQQGIMSFSDPVSKYLPQFATENLIILVPGSPKDKPEYAPAKTTMTIQHLFNFTSGLWYTMPPAWDRQNAQYTAEHAEVNFIEKFIDSIKGDLPGVPLNFEPGTDFVYGWSSDILGFVVEKASGINLEEFFKRNIFDPLGMKSTSFYQTPNLQSKRVPLNHLQTDEATGEKKLGLYDPNIRLFETDPKKVRLHLGGVGLYASAKDYLSFLRHILQLKAGTAPNPILNSEYLAKVFEPALPPSAQKSLQGLFDIALEAALGNAVEGMWQWTVSNALTMKDKEDRRKKGSIAWSGWANTHHFLDPTTGIAVILQTQMLPPLNISVLKYYDELEKTLYAGLE